MTGLSPMQLIFLIFLLISVFVGVMAGTLTVYYAARRAREDRWDEK